MQPDVLMASQSRGNQAALFFFLPCVADRCRPRWTGRAKRRSQRGHFSVRRCAFAGAAIFAAVRPFELAFGSVRAISFRKLSSMSEAVCFAFTNERSMAEILTEIGRASC